MYTYMYICACAVGAALQRQLLARHRAGREHQRVPGGPLLVSLYPALWTLYRGPCTM